MTKFDYSGLNATAERLIARFGKAGVLTQITNSGPGWDPVQVETDHDVQLAVMEYSRSQVDGTLIQQGDKMVYVSTEGLTVEPSTADKLTFDSKKYSVVNVMPTRPGETTLMYELQVRI